MFSCNQTIYKLKLYIRGSYLFIKFSLVCSSGTQWGLILPTEWSTKASYFQFKNFQQPLNMTKLTRETKDRKLWLDGITHFLKEHITEEKDLLQNMTKMFGTQWRRKLIRKKCILSILYFRWYFINFDISSLLLNV